MADHQRKNNGKVSQGLPPGYHVLFRNLTPQGGQGKIRAFWVFRSRKVDLGVVDSIKRKDNKGESKTVHRNLLCEKLPGEYIKRQKYSHCSPHI